MYISKIMKHYKNKVGAKSVSSGFCQHFIPIKTALWVWKKKWLVWIRFILDIIQLKSVYPYIMHIYKSVWNPDLK